MKIRIFYLLFYLNCIQLTAQNGGEWTWMHGDASGNTSSFGTKGVSSPNNLPPARYHPAYWQDRDHNLWIFGNSSGTNFADMWKYNTTINEWTWMHGSNTLAGSYGVYGVKGIPSPNNYPKNRGYGASCWIDSIGDLWMFAGSYCSDLWKYKISTNEWTWMGGANPNIKRYDSVYYGTKNISISTNFPGSRMECKSNYVYKNELILFSGSLFSDVWSYNISNNLWTWIGGKNTNSSQVKGTIRVPHPNNIPSGGATYCKWRKEDKIFMFGGSVGEDVWSFNLTTKLFSWEHGGNYNPPPSNCHHNQGYSPGARMENHTIQTGDCNSSFWTYGGGKADLWYYYLDSNYWIRMSHTTNPSYGTKGVKSITNHPSDKYGFAIWNDRIGNLYTFGGFDGFGGSSKMSNLIWKFEPYSSCLGTIILNSSQLQYPNKTVRCGGNDTITLDIDSSLNNITWFPNNSVKVNLDTTKLSFFPSTQTTYQLKSEGGSCKPFDSILFTIKIGQHTYDTIYDTSCPYQKYPYGSSGVYNYKIPNAIGCDSFIQLHLFIDSTRVVLDTLIQYLDCGQSFVFKGTSYSTPDTYNIHSNYPNACDTITHLRIIRKIAIDQIIIDNQCLIPKTVTIVTSNYGVDSFSKDTGKKYQAFRGFFGLKAGKYLFRIKKPCGIRDTVIEVLDESFMNTFYQMACKEYTYNGKKYKTSGIIRDTVRSQNNCDSISIIHLTINKHDTFTENYIACQNKPFKYIDSTWTKSGQYQYLLYKNTYCDSLIRINLTVKANPFFIENKSICKNQSIYGYNTSGIYIDTMIVPGRCDSIRELRLTVLDTSSSSFQKEICRNETFFFNNQNLSTLGYYKDTLTNSKGCDSYVYLNLIRKSIVNSDFKTICTGQSYKGYSNSGTYSTTTQDANGCDSVESIVLTVLPPPFALTQTLSDCHQVLFKNNIYYLSTTVLDTVSNYLGCDSIYRTTHIEIMPKAIIQNPISLVFCDSIRIGDRLYTNSVSKIDTIKSKLGLHCDSIYRPLYLEKKNSVNMEITASPFLDEYIKNEILYLEANLALHYQWSTFETTQKIKIQPKEDNVYYVIGWNDIECKDTAYIHLKVVDPSILDIPNAFAPNGKIENRFFKPNFYGKIENIKFDIYNRWGEKVYSTDTLNNIGWDGNYKGSPSPSGVYSYIIEYKANRNIYFKSGEFTLFR